MRRFILILSIIFLLNTTFASEWGIFELKTEVYSEKDKTSQRYSFLLERWWDESLGISINLYYEDYFKYRLGLQTSYLRSIYGYFEPNLNYYTKYLDLKGLFLGVYILNDEVYFLKGDDILSLGWQRPFTPHNLANFSITSYKDNYILDINLLQQYPLPLGNSYAIEEISLIMKESKIYISGILRGELSIGNFSLKGYIGTNHSQGFNLCDINPGELGGEIYLRTPLTPRLMNAFNIGYFHDFDNGLGRLKLGYSFEWLLSSYLNIESSISLEYLFKEIGEYKSSQSIQLNFPTMDGSLVGSVYWKMDNSAQTIGLKLSYQF
jgi:hypothetical protein